MYFNSIKHFTKIRFITIKNRTIHGHSNFYIVSAGNWLIEVEKLRYVMILLWERQGYEKERSCFHTKLLLSIEFDTTCEPGATFSQRWHQSFSQRFFDRLLQVAVEVCMWLLPPQHSKRLTFRNKKQKGKKHSLAYGILLFVSPLTHTTAYGQFTGKRYRVPFPFELWLLSAHSTLSWYRLFTEIHHRFKTELIVRHLHQVSKQECYVTLVLQVDSAGFPSK